MEQMTERKMAAVRLKVALAGVVFATSIGSAQQAARPAVTGIKGPVMKGRHAATAAPKSAREVKSIINGVAVDKSQTRLPRATVRLRNLAINDIEQVVTANELGEFSFVAQPNVPYVVEVADYSGRVVAVGDVIVANAGEVAGTVVSVPGRLPAVAGIFGDTASSVISAATGTGLTVVDPEQPKVSPTR